jgi:uncharacterized protein (TIGR02594 family)
MILRTIFVGALLCVVCSSSYACDVMRPCYGNGRQLFAQTSPVVSGKKHAKSAVRHRLSPGLSRVMAEGAGRAVNWIKPRAWCGWQMRVWLGVANPAGNLARWWAGYGRDAHGPHVGAIVVWPRGRRHGHVGIITGRTADGRWIVKSGNDGHRVRERPRSVAGAIAFRWPV